jgi:hypothetical protein
LIADEIMATVPAHAHSIAYFPSRDALSQSVKMASDFVARDTWILQARPQTLFYKDIAVADPTSLDLYTHLAWARFGDTAFNQLKIAAWLVNLSDFHFCIHVFVSIAGEVLTPLNTLRANLDFQLLLTARNDHSVPGL